MFSIRELKAQQLAALKAYHAEYLRLEAEIEEIRKARGTKLKTPVYEEFYEAGRSRERVPGMGQ
jgi:hypothetical protein